MTKDQQRLAVGDTAPDFELPTDSGEMLRLSDLRGKRVVLYFYPKDDTPGCTAQACGFRDAYEEIEAKDAVVLGISPDSSESHRQFRGQYNLPFTLLVDEDHKVAEQYGVWGEKKLFGKSYMGIIRSSFVIDEEGKILDARYKVSPDDSVTEALRALRTTVEG